MSDTNLAKPECDGMCLTGSDVGVPSAKIAYPHPGCPAHAPGERCECGQPDRCTSYTHDPVWLAANPTEIEWVQDEPRPDTPEDREYRESEQERTRLVEECRTGNGHSWWLELEHPEDGAGVDLSCEHCPAGIDDLYPDGIDMIGGHLDEVTVDAGKHNSPVPLLIPVDCEVLTTHISNPIVGEDWEAEFTVAPRGPARPVNWVADQTTAITSDRPGCASCFCRHAGCANQEQHHHLAVHGDYLKWKAGVRQNPPAPDPLEASLGASEELWR